MCGIVGCIGKINANEVVLKGLERLEYRGYDSCGIASIDEGSFHISKSTNRITDLIEINELSNNIAIGHTRWATHGGVTLSNAHPHQASNGRFILVHNGVVDNYLDLKEKFCGGIEFNSQTDTEVILEVLNVLVVKYGTFEKAMVEFFNVVHGSYSCVVMDIENQDKLFTFKNKTPMLIGTGKEFYTISSDPCACYDIADTFYRLDDKEFAIIDITDNSVNIFDVNGKPVDFKFEVVDIDDFILELGDYDCFMLKEIEEQPSVIKNIIKQYSDYTINFELKTKLLNANRIYIVASGTSYNAGLIGKRMIQRDLKIPTKVVLGSEFGYDDNLIDDNSFFIFMSQSGETADSMVVFNNVVGKYPTLAITNTKGSQLDQRADYNMRLHASIEIAVASTKAYTANIAVAGILVGLLKGNVSEVITKLETVIIEQQKILDRKEELKAIALKIAKHKEAIMIGRLLDYDISLEAALKIKEVTYTNINCYPGGELKHGPISLVDKDMLVLALIGQKNIAESTRSNIEEIKARDGQVITFVRSDLSRSDDDFKFDFEVDELYVSMVSTIPFQYISYYVAIELGLDVDKPRNLAKAVTVE